MSDSFPPPWQRRPASREPAFNIAPAVLGLAVVLLAIHAIRSFVLSGEADQWTLVAFAFIPDRTLTDLSLELTPGGDLARYWSFVTYAFLHGDWTHVLVNVLWMVAFGSPLGFRWGTLRFLLFSAVGAIAGALIHLALYPHDASPLVGASAAISAHMAAVVRFAFNGGGMFGFGRDVEVHRLPAPPLMVTLQNTRVLAFLGIWFGMNILFGVFAQPAGIASGAVAWDAHVGGFLAGLLLFPLFDRRWR